MYFASLLLGGNIPFYRYMQLVIIFGGFLFTMLWEAMSRYVFPYVIYMLPLAAMGWDFAGERLEKAVNVLGRKRTVNKDQERGE